MFSKARNCNVYLRFQFYIGKHSFCSNSARVLTSAQKFTPGLSSGNERKKENVDSESKFCFGIGKSVLSKCSYSWEKKDDSFAESSSLQDLLGMSLCLSPETTRRFWRASGLKAEDFLEILLGFGPETDVRKVDFLWKLFKWAAKQGQGFRHLPRSYEIMISMLIQENMLEDAETLLLWAEAQGVFSEPTGLFSKITQGYAEVSKLDNSVALYDQMRKRGLVPSISCYQALLDLLTRNMNTELVVRVYADMIEVGLGSNTESHVLDYVVGELTKKGEILGAVNILKRVKTNGIKTSSEIFTAIVEGYNKKKDFEDMVNFMAEWQHVPEAHVCNKITSSLCKNLGCEEAWPFVERMEALGFSLDATTLGILICYSCRERKLKHAFIYLAECFPRNIKPSLYAYNALICGVFMMGLDIHAKDVFEDMLEKGLEPEQSTFEILLAGYCKYRKFDEVKLVVGKMVDYGMVTLAPVEDKLSKAFKLLGLDSLGVKVKRDNYAGLPQAEFFDSLGNGLYLETNIEEYDRIIDGILDCAMIPDFDYVLQKEFQQGCVQNVLRVKEIAIQWGHVLSFSTYSELLKQLGASATHATETLSLLEEMPDLRDQLDDNTLNFLIRSLSNNGMTKSAWLVFVDLIKKEMLIESNTYITLIMGFCKEKNINKIRECLVLAEESGWLLVSKDMKALSSCLCKYGMIPEVLELFDYVVAKDPVLLSAVLNCILEELCAKKFTWIGCVLLEEILHRGLILDHTAYIYLINGFVSEQKFAEALGIIGILLEKSINPCASVYQLFMPLLIRLNRVDEVINLKQTMLDKKLEAIDFIYATLLYHLGRTGKTEEATFQLQEMLVHNVLPDGKILNALMHGFCQEKNLVKACEILSTMLRLHIDLSLSSYRNLVRQFCAHGQIPTALNLKKLMHRQGELQTIILYNILIYYLFWSGKDLLVEALLNEMQAKNVIPDQVTYNFLINGFFKCSNISKSVVALEKMIIDGFRPSNRSFRVVISYLCNNGKLDKALELSKQMECFGWKHDSVSQNTLVGSLLSCRRFQEAELFLNRMEAKDLIPSNMNFDFLIKQFCLHKRTRKAIKLLNIMLKKGNHPSESSYSQIIHGLCICKSFDLALDFHAEMRQRNLEPSIKACDALIYGLCGSGRVNDAKGVLEDMLQSGPRPTQCMYNYVINMFYAENDLEEAAKLVHKMQENGCLPSFETHWSLVSNLSISDGTRSNYSKGLLSLLLS